MRTGTQGGIEMKAFPFKSNLLVLTLTLLFVLGPGSGKAQDDVKIRGEKLPSDVLHVVDTQFQDPNNEGVQQIQFRDLSYSQDEAKELFLSTDPDENLLRLVGETLANDHQVKFRGTVDGTKFEAQVERHDDGTLRTRIKGLDISGMAPEQLGEFLSNGFDRLRIRGTNGERLEIRRRDDGTIRAEIRGINISEYTPEQFMSLAAENGFDRLRIRGTNGERFELKQQDDGTLRAKMEGMDVSGMTPEQLMDLAKEKGLDRLRIRGSDGQRFEIKRKDDGTLRADFRGMDVRAYTPEQITNLAKERGLDRVRIRGVDKDGNRVRIEYRQDKGIVKWEGAGRGVNEVSSRLNNKPGRDRGRDRENKLRDRVERERERIDRSDHRGRGRDRVERLRDRVESRVRDLVERHGGSGRH